MQENLPPHPTATSTAYTACRLAALPCAYFTTRSPWARRNVATSAAISTANRFGELVALACSMIVFVNRLGANFSWRLAQRSGGPAP